MSFVKAISIDDAIQHCLDVVEEKKNKADKYNRWDEWESVYADECIQCATDHQQLAKRLLKAAVEDLNSVNRVLEGNDILCMKYIACEGCPFNGENCNKWRYANEVLKLIES